MGPMTAEIATQVAYWKLSCGSGINSNILETGGFRDMTLEDLGTRICILGPSNSGKSTLAVAIARKRGLSPIHLDQMQHRPCTDWQTRNEAEFLTLHDDAIAADRWVIDGNSSRYLPQRLERATGMILLDVSTGLSLVRYFHRCWFESERLGGLEGGKDSVKWMMIKHIAVTQRRGRKMNAARFTTFTKPKISLTTPQALADFYSFEHLEW